LTEPIFHLAEPRDWAAGVEGYQPATFDEEGFIHCSTATQLPEVARRHFDGRNDLVLLTIDPGSLDDESLVYEDLYGLGEEFPHVYGPIPGSAIVATGPYLGHLEEGLWLESRWNREWMERMLHPEFSEVGRSGRTYNREETLAVTATDLDVIVPDGYDLTLIDEDVALVRYVTRERVDHVDRRAHRTSLWVNTNEGWRLRFHQGTPIPQS
jgi:uncharacterized protein (DUF952 family)